MRKAIIHVGKRFSTAPFQIYRAWKTTRSASLLFFFKEIIKNPKAMGAACPSSSKLANSMAAAIPLPVDGIIIELGGGTGSITNAILKHGVPAEKLYVFERSRPLCKLLREKFKGVNIIEDDAESISRWIPKNTKVSAVISGLPLKSLPADSVKKISQELSKVLPPGCTLIQFTYDLRRKRILKLKSRRTGSKVIWNNIPPARIDISKLL